MTTSTATSDLPDELRAVHDTMLGLRSEYGQVQNGLKRQFDELELLRAELVRQADALEQDRRRMSEREQEVARQRQATERLVQLIEENSARVAAVDDPASETVAALLREQHTFQQQALQQQLERTQAELAKRTDSAEQLSEVRGALAEARGAVADSQVALATTRGELAEARAELAETRGELAEARGELAAALRQVDLLHQQIAQRELEARQTPVLAANHLDPAAEVLDALEQERDGLLTELELVRGRAAELYETVNEQKRELADLRSWAGEELRGLRAWCERQAVAVAGHHDGNPVVEPSTTSPPVPQVAFPQQAERSQQVERAQQVEGAQQADRSPADPVLSSLMAQFARLQQDASHRRQTRR